MPICFIIITLLIRMSKAKSQPSEYYKNQPKNKSDFVYKSEDDMYLFQTRDLFMQVQFKSPIKQIQQYLEQYQKYCFHAQMTSIGIKSSQQKMYYDQIANLINSDFQLYLQKTMGFIQVMLMNVHFMKVERWHYFAQLIRGYKTQVLQKDIDCYQFNPNQFREKYEEVMDYLSKQKDITAHKNRKEIQQIKSKIRKWQKQIKYKLDQMYDNMFVKNPIRTQNQSKKQVDSDILFNGYINKIMYKTECYQSCLIMRFHNAYDQVTKFFAVLKQLSIKGQQMAVSIIKQYNDNCAQTIDQIVKNKFKFDKKIQIELNECKMATKRNDKLDPILRNKIERVDISNRVICKDQQNSDIYGLIFVEDTKILTPIKTEDDQLFSNRVPANNPYFDFWSHVYDRDRLRKLQLFYQMPKKYKINTQGPSRQYPSRYIKKDNKDKMLIEQNNYYEVIAERERQQTKVWEVKQKKQGNCRKTYEYMDEIYKKDAYYRPSPEEQTKLDKLTMKVRAYKQYHDKNDKQLKYQVQSKLAKLPKPTPTKNYLEYTRKFGIKDSREQSGPTTIFRYGIELHKVLTDNSVIPKLQQFLFNFLREKLFRQTEKHKDKDSTPLVFNGRPAQQFCNLKTIKKLGELTKDFKRYYIWACDIIKYEQFQQLIGMKKEVKGKFTFYSYTNIKNCRSLLFELKRRLNMKITGQIIDIYRQFGPSCVESSLSKLQLMHRLLFNQHMETPTADLSFEKGRLLYNSMIKSLSASST